MAPSFSKWNTKLICDSITELFNQQTVAWDWDRWYDCFFQPWFALIKMNFITGSGKLWDMQQSLFLLNYYKTTYSTSLNPHLLQHPPLSSCSDRWLLGGLGEQDSTAAQKSPTGVLLTGCPLSSVPISPWPSPHLGRCSERSTGGRWEDTLQSLKLLCNKHLFKV